MPKYSHINILNNPPRILIFCFSLTFCLIPLFELLFPFASIIHSNLYPSKSFSCLVSVLQYNLKDLHHTLSRLSRLYGCSSFPFECLWMGLDLLSLPLYCIQEILKLHKLKDANFRNLGKLFGFIVLFSGAFCWRTLPLLIAKEC